jgi:DNA modification methylase
MHIVPIDRIVIGKRQRTSIDPVKLRELADSIVNEGLLHAPVCWLDDTGGTDMWPLTVGERRFAAIKLIHAEGKPLRHNNTVIPSGFIPITRLDEKLDEIGRFEAELNENTRRVNLDWQDETRALADLHEMRQRYNPKQTFEQTATEAVSRNITANQTVAGAAQEVRDAVLVAGHLGNEKVAKARNVSEARGIILRMEEEAILATLTRRMLAAAPKESDVEIRHGDMFDLLPKMPINFVDLICADPPYGIDAGSGGFRARTVIHHNYEDTPEEARKIAMCILTEGFRVTKPRANLFMFCDIKLFDFLKVAAANMGWTPFPRPGIWRKSESEGLAPWGGAGFRITTEFFFFATKGQRGLHASPIDVFDFSRVSRNTRTHAAEKPVEFMEKLISVATMPDDMILDPCCGSGSAIVAAKKLKRRAIGIEKDKDYYNTAMANVFGGDVK